MTPHQKDFAAAINLVLAVVREHGVDCEAAGGISTLLTCRPLLLIGTLAPETSLAIWHESKLSFQAVWISQNEFRIVVFEDGPWQEAVGVMVETVLRAKPVTAAEVGQSLH